MSWFKRRKKKDSFERELAKEIEALNRERTLREEAALLAMRGVVLTQNPRIPRTRVWSSEHPMVNLESIRAGDTFRAGAFHINGTKGGTVDLIVPIGNKGRVIVNELHVGDIIDLPRGLEQSVFGRVLSIESYLGPSIMPEGEAVVVRYMLIKEEDDTIGRVETSNWLNTTKLDIKSSTPTDVDQNAAELARLALQQISS